MWQRILVPHDFSSSANHAAALARDEAKAHGGEVLLLHVVDLPSGFSPDTQVAGLDAPIKILEYAMMAATEHLRDLATRLEADGVAVSTFVRVGHPVEEILRLSREHEADAIVMGTHGRSALRQLLAGSVAERVVRASHIPVVTTRHP